MRSKYFCTNSVAVLLATCVVAGGFVSAARADDAKATYDKTCATCHGPGGKGDGAVGKMLKPPPKEFAAALAGAADADIAKVIKEGGKAVGKSASMPAYGSKLNDEQIKGLVQYIKGLK